MRTYVQKSECVDIEIDFDEIVSDLDEDSKQELITRLTGSKVVPFGRGDGDVPRINNVIERAYLVAKKMDSIPREIADLFWVVHGRAL